MSYVKQTWTDRLTEFFRRFSAVEDANGNVQLTDEPGTVAQEGTSITAAKLNHMEDGIEGAHDDLAAHLAEFANQLNFNGYQKLPGGLILQWGQITIPADAGYVDVTLPIAFPAIIRNVQATVEYVSTGEGGSGTTQLHKMVTTQYSGNTTITLYVRNPDQTIPNVDIRVDWQALGY